MWDRRFYRGKLGEDKVKARRGMNTLEAFEPRLLLAAAVATPLARVLENTALAQGTVTAQAADNTNSSNGSSVAVTGSVPKLHSLSSAKAKIFLDFDGAPAFRWGGYNAPATPAYSQDSNKSTFTTTELSSIKEIWARVSEIFSPFNLDVTTEDPGSSSSIVRVIIGGDGTWYTPTHCAGVSYIGCFRSGYSTAFVFSDNTASWSPGRPATTAPSIAHEVGHAFGLVHQSKYTKNSNGSYTKTEEYSSGNGSTAPFMGAPFKDRNLWYVGTSSTGAGVIQDDMAIIAGSANGFGYRTDDHGNSTNNADSLDLSGCDIHDSGIIERTSDVDWFSFTAGSNGTASVTLSPYAYGGMLDGILELRNSSGTVIASASGNNAGASRAISTNITKGSRYYVTVRSKGDMGNVGQYTLTGKLASGSTGTGTTTPANNSTPTTPPISTTNPSTKPTTPTTPATSTTPTTPTNPTPVTTTTAPVLLSSIWSNQKTVKLTWRDTTSNESGFYVEYIPAGKAYADSSWTRLATVSGNGSSVGNTLSYTTPILTSGMNYFRIRSYNSAGVSLASNVLAVWF